MTIPAYYDTATGVLTDGEAWVGLGTTTLGSDTATVTFTSTDDGQVGDWSQYMDLVVVWYARSDRASTNNDFIVRFNNDTSSNYPIQLLSGSGAAVNGYTATNTFAYMGDLPAASSTANQFSAGVATFFDVNSGKYKSVLAQSAKDADGSGYVSLFAATWKSQAPITEIDLIASGNNLVAGTHIDLFGVLPRMVA
jgi:hypothetical protein